MIFISGVHGVGKSYFTHKVEERCGIETYTASELIAKSMNCSFDKGKKVSNISYNQQVLFEALEDKKSTEKEFLLDGHFCLLNSTGEIEQIELNTYINLDSKAIIILTENVEIIAERRINRDGIKIDIDAIDTFQKQEKKYGLEVADKLKVPVFVSFGSKDIENAIDFIMQYI